MGPAKEITKKLPIHASIEEEVVHPEIKAAVPASEEHVESGESA